MANPEHVEIVKRGKEAIDEWREANPEERLDLEGASLKDLRLAGADLRRAQFKAAYLQGADFSGADLREAYLMQACIANSDLSSANLHKAVLFDADLTVTSLSDADLSESSLSYCNLTGASLNGADLTKAELGSTVLCDVDLSDVRGLETLLHEGPSSIDERTLRMSWPLPDVFLRGIGTSEELINFARATYGEAIEFYSCFISYSSKDDEFAKRLHADLQGEGVRCWFAPEDLRIGDKFRLRIDEAIRLHDKLLLILSGESVNSPWVENEVESAFEKEENAKEKGEDRTVLFPIRLDSAVMDTDAAWAASIRRTRHIGDFSAWKDHDAYQKSFERLLRDLKAGAKD
ncbi:MAG: toll/interleukin-1 receptor domain-containing protein [Chloroflexi bacterium]|nr:toll/interleukin-1 receptor domain-containing protein [Chloroflexota bacterium]